jgi:hypothetical protein
MSPAAESTDHSAAGLVATDAGTSCVEDTGHDSYDQAVPKTSDEGHAVN